MQVLAVVLFHLRNQFFESYLPQLFTLRRRDVCNKFFDSLHEVTIIELKNL